MSEYQLFCFGKDSNKDGYQRKKYGAFNKQVTESRWNELKKQVESILPKHGTLCLSDYWKKVSQEQWLKLLTIPEAKDFNEGFSFISGIKITEPVKSLSGKEVSVTIDGNTYTAIIK